MDEESNAGRIAVVLEHWMGHNRGHVEEFTKWAEKAKASGHAKVSERIVEAARQMHKANAILDDALCDLSASNASNERGGA